MSVYYCGFNTFCQAQVGKSEALLTPYRLVIPGPVSDSTSTDTSPGDFSQFLLSWSSIVYINENGKVFQTNYKSTDGEWKRLDSTERVLSSAVGWAEYWLLQKNGRIVHFDDRHSDCDVMVKTSYEVRSHDVSTGVGPDAIRLVHISAGEMYTIGCSEAGQVGEIQVYSESADRTEQTKKYAINSQWLLWKPVMTAVKITQVSCGKEHVMLLSNSGQVFTFGMSSRGQLGHGSTENCQEARLVEALDGLCITVVSAGGWHSAAVSDIGDVYVWGWNESGQLGLPSKNLAEEQHQDNKSTNQQTVLFVTEPHLLDVADDATVTDVSCGSRHSAIVTALGDLLTTGWNGHGQLGHGDVTTRDCFTVVDSLKRCGMFIEKVHCGYWGTLMWIVKPEISKTV